MPVYILYISMFLSLRKKNHCADSALVYVRDESCDTKVDYPYVNIVLENPEHEQSYDMSRCTSQ